MGVRVSLWRRQRSARFRFARWPGGLDLAVGSPTVHRWWAFALTVTWGNR